MAEKEVTSEQVNRWLDDAGQILSDGVTTIANTKGISHEDLEAVYSIGYSHYAAGRFDVAERVFHFLTLFSHTDAKYWTALGAAQQAQRQFEKAMQAYTMAVLFDIEKPKAFYFAAECALALGQLEGAVENARSLLQYCAAGTAENDAYRAKATALVEKVTRMIAEAAAKKTPAK